MKHGKTMAGMLPGVELARRRRAHSHGSYDSRPSCPRPSVGPTSMDEVAIQARSRLEQKLGSFSSRFHHHQKNKEIASDSPASLNETRSVGKIKREKLVHVPRLNRSSSEKELCSICLDEFQAQQGVMNLPCCHRYHSDCLLPWLASNSHCPYCRTHVNPWISFSQ